jgi:hypothetical protein
VLFSNIPIGTYTASVNTGGYVDPSGTQGVTLQDQEVVSGSVTVGSITYDRAATVAATVQSYPPNATNSTAFFTSKAPAVSGVNGTKVGLIRTTPNPVTQTTYSLISSPALFPFVNKYAFFTGQCEYSNPATYDTTSPAFSYWASTPTPPGQIQVLPGQSNMPVSVRQPPLLVNIKRKSGTLSGGGPANITAAGQVKVVALPQIQNGDDCAEAPVYDLTNVSWTSGDGAPTANSPLTLGWVGRINSVNIGGKLIPDAGVPFGKYKFCLEDTTVTPHKKTVWPDTVDPTKQPYDASKSYPGTTGTSSNINNPLTINATSAMWSTGTC